MPCEHTYIPCEAYPDYSRCVHCGTYKSLTAPPAEEVYTADYWTHEAGHSTLEEQVYNCESHLENGISKDDFILKFIDAPSRVFALEIGCAPGSFLGRLYHDLGFAYLDGIEVQNGWDDCIHEIARIPKKPSLYDKNGSARVDEPDALCLWHGVFPHVNAHLQPDWYSLIVASDVFEHSHQPEAFLAECARLLKPNGQLILVLPLVCGADVPERMFNAREHVYIHSLKNMREMLKDAGLTLQLIARWCAGHDLLTARKVEE